MSEDEYSLARYMGYGDHEIVYNGPYKGEQSFRAVLQAGGIVNLDSMQEVRWLKDLAADCPQQTFRVGIRANFNLEKMCPGETTMGEVMDASASATRPADLKKPLLFCARFPMWPLPVSTCTPAVNPAASISSAPLHAWHVSCRKNFSCSFPTWIWAAVTAAVWKAAPNIPIIFPQSQRNYENVLRPGRQS